MSVNRNDVIWAYRLFLEREPESEQAIEQKLRSVNSISELRSQFLASPEFQNRSGLVAAAPEGNVIIKEIDGVRLFIDLSDLHIGLNIVNGVYERDELDLIRRTVKQGQSVIDVGANIGFFTIMLADCVGPSGRVHAFEPLPRNFGLLEQSVAENDFQNRVTIECAAVGAEPGRMHLISPCRTNNWGGPYLRTGNDLMPPGHEAREVVVVQLDRHSLRRPISFVKLDAEGAELMVLQGARSILQTDRPLVLAEMNPKQLQEVSRCSANDLIGEMASTGYVCNLLGTGGSQSRITHYDTDRLANVLFLPKELY